MDKLARFVIRNRWWVIVGWIVFILLANGVSRGLGGANYKDEFKLPHTQTQTVSNLFKSSGQNNQNGLDGLVVLHATTGDLKTAPATLTDALTGLCRLGAGVVTVDSPWGSIDCATGGALRASGANAKLLSTSDPSIAIVDVTFKGGGTLKQSAIDKVYNSLKQVRSSSLEVQFTGDGFQGVGAKNGNLPEIIGVLAAFVILTLVFRTVGAIVLPLASALVALSTGLGLIGILTHAMSVSQVTPELSQLMVIGVGVDYALFIVTRHRRNLLRGMSVEDSIVSALNTSGRAVLFAGTTVCIAMLGLITLGVNFFYGMAIGVAVAVLVGLTAFLRYTRFGLVIRAGVENRAMVAALGIDVRRAFTIVFALGGALAALAGVLSGVYFGVVDPGRGTSLLIFAFIVVVIGGFGSIGGSAVAAVAVGLIQQYANYYASSGTGDLAVVLLLAAVLLVRPAGLAPKVAH